MARAMLNSKNLSKRLWAETLNTACYTINHVSLRSGTKKTPYELWKGKMLNLGCMCFILNDREHLDKFDSKSGEGVFSWLFK